MCALEEICSPSCSIPKQTLERTENLFPSDIDYFLFQSMYSRSSSSFISSLLNSILSFDSDQLQKLYEKLDKILKMVNAENNLYELHIKHLQHIYQLSFSEDPRKSDQTISTLATVSVLKIQRSSEGGFLSLSTPSSLKIKQNSNSSTCTLSEVTQHFRYPSPVRQQKKQKLKISFRFTMLGDEMEYLQRTFERQMNKIKISKQDYLSSILEINESLVQMRNTATHMEKILTGDELTFSLTKKIPAQKFIKVFTDLLKHNAEVEGNLKMEMMRLKRDLKPLNEEVKEKRELSESINAISFEELQIVTKENAKKLEEKTKHLYEMEKITGKCSQDLNIKKRDLDESLKKLRKVQKTTQKKTLLLSKVREMKHKASEETSRALEKQISIKRLTERYKAPSILYLAQKKAELLNIERNIKNCSRRIECQKNIKCTLKKQLKGNSTEHVNRFGWLKKTSFEKKMERLQFEGIDNSNQSISNQIKQFRIKPGHDIYL